MATKDLFGWFTPEHERVLGTLMDDHDIKHVLEIGSFLGKSTAFFAKRADRVVCVDPFKAWPEGNENEDARRYGEDFYEQFEANMVAEGVIHKLSIARTTSEMFFDTHRQMPGVAPHISMAYIDGAHDAESVRKDIEGCLKVGGPLLRVICGDDYDGAWPGVKEAVDAIFGERVRVVGRVWYVILF